MRKKLGASNGTLDTALHKTMKAMCGIVSLHVNSINTFTVIVYKVAATLKVKMYWW